MREQLILDLLETIKVLHVVALTMDLIFFVIQVSNQECLKCCFFIFISFWVFSLTFGVGQGFICAKYDWLGQNFPFSFCFNALCFFISWKSFKSGNTVNTDYLNRIPNPKSRIPNWSECTAPLCKIVTSVTLTLIKVFLIVLCFTT